MIDNIGKYISDELRSIRSLKNKSIFDVSESTNINKDTLYKYEKDASGIKIYILDKILNYYDISIFIFFNNIL